MGSQRQSSIAASRTHWNPGGHGPLLHMLAEAVSLWHSATGGWQMHGGPPSEGFITHFAAGSRHEPPQVPPTGWSHGGGGGLPQSHFVFPEASTSSTQVNAGSSHFPPHWPVLSGLPPHGCGPQVQSCKVSSKTHLLPTPVVSFGQTPPQFVQPPAQRWQPTEAALDHDKTQIR